MTALLAKWMRTEELREPFEVEALEGGARQVRHGGLDYSIRIDRCDRLAGGGRVLIDYKTGMAAVDWRGDRPDNPQLPIYALLQPEELVAVAYGRVNAADCCFVAESARPRGFQTARPRVVPGGDAGFRFVGGIVVAAHRSHRPGIFLRRGRGRAHGEGLRLVQPPGVVPDPLRPGRRRGTR